MRLEDECGDEVEVEFHDDGAAEFSVLSGDLLTEGRYMGGFILRPEEGKRLLRRLEKWLENTPDEGVEMPV